MAAGAAIEFRRERAELGGEDRIVAIHDRRLQPCAAEMGALAKEEAQVLNRLGFAVDGVGGVGGELYDRRDFSTTGGRNGPSASARKRSAPMRATS
jgi:hypothetical protein